MHRLVTMLDSPRVAAVMRRLERAAITATVTEEPTVADLYLGSRRHVSIWLARELDLEPARAIVEALEQERIRDRCPDCDYDLAGHSGETSCPECGATVRAALPDRPCPSCRAPVPGDFEVCWKCGTEIDDTPSA